MLERFELPVRYVSLIRLTKKGGGRDVKTSTTVVDHPLDGTNEL